MDFNKFLYFPSIGCAIQKIKGSKFYEECSKVSVKKDFTKSADGESPIQQIKVKASHKALVPLRALTKASLSCL
jgi:hypothetical protein